MSNVVRMSSTSLEYLRARVSATSDGVAIDPTGFAIEFAFPIPGEDPSTWVAGSWEVAGTFYYARCLVGPSGGVITLANGIYDVYVRVTASPEKPVRQVGVLVVE